MELPSLILSVFFVLATTDLATAVIGGKFYDISKYPYNVNIKYDNYTECGGALVTNRHVITAAHCVKGMPIDLISVTAGADFIEGIWSYRAPFSYVAKMWVHPRYTIQTMNYDIAVLKLKSPLTGKNIKPIRLPEKPLKPGVTVTVTGWGHIFENGYNSMRMKAAAVKMWTFKKCKQSYKGDLKSTMICANNPGKDSCKGDDGGPLARKGVLYGVVSWGKGCGRPRYPGIYTNVYAMRKFIKPKLKL